MLGQSVDVLVVGCIAFVAHVEDGGVICRQEDVGLHQDVVGINGQVVVASTDVTRQFDQLLEQPTASVNLSPIGTGGNKS